jgi:hypothetical protein
MSDYRYPEFQPGGDNEFPPVTQYGVREKELEDLRRKMNEKEKNGGKKTEDVSLDTEREVYKDLYKRQLHEKYSAAAEKEKEKAIEDEKSEREHQEWERMKRRGTANKQEFDEKYPVLGGVMSDVYDVRDYVTESNIGKWVKGKLEDRNDRELINHGVPLSKIRKYNELKNKADIYEANYDKEGAKEVKDDLRELKRDINQDVQSDNTRKLEKEIEQKRLQKLLNPQSPSRPRSYKSPSLPKSMQYSRNVKTPTFTAPHAGENFVKISKPNVGINSFENYGNLQFARQRVVEKQQREAYDKEMKRRQQIEREQFLSQIFMNRQNVNHVRGDVKNNLKDAKLIKTPTAGRMNFTNPVGLHQGVLFNKKSGGGMNTPTRFNFNLFGANVPMYGAVKPVTGRSGKPTRAPVAYKAKQLEIKLPSFNMNAVLGKKKKGRK